VSIQQDKHCSGNLVRHGRNENWAFSRFHDRNIGILCNLVSQVGLFLIPYNNVSCRMLKYCMYQYFSTPNTRFMSTTLLEGTILKTVWDSG